MMRRSIFFCLLIAILFGTQGFADYTITGVIRRPLTGVAISSVNVSATNGVATVKTNSSGVYTLTVPNNWSGTVTPSKDGFYFDPVNRSYSEVRRNYTYQDYDAYDVPVISGQVTTLSGALSGVTITASNNGGSTTTAANGSYSLEVPYKWSGSLIPSKDGYYFTPSQIALSNVTGDLTYKDFTARLLPTISGNIKTAGGTPVSNVEITATNGVASVFTDSSGDYTLTVSNNWSGTVTPVKEGYSFNPATKTYTNITSSRTGQDYTGYLPPVISGYITTVSGSPQGVLVTASNGAGTYTTGQDGYYEITVPYQWTGTVTPSKDGYYFNPKSNSYTNITVNQTANYSGGLLPVITGTIADSQGNPIDGVDVTTDNDGGSSTTDSNGTYSISVPYNWSGTVNPSKARYTFDPTDRSYSNVVSDRTNQHFVGTAPLIIAGYIQTQQGTGIAGVIALADNGGSLTLSDVDGYYQLLVPVGWSGTVKVQKVGYTFEPAQTTYSNVTSNLFNQNIEGLLHNMKIYCWGDDVFGQCDVPEENDHFIAISAGHSHSLAVKSDGTVFGWGQNSYTQCDVPVPNEDFVTVAAGYMHSLALKIDRSVVAWGNNTSGQCNVPTPNSNYVMIAAGGAHSLALTADGTVSAWGANDFGQCNVPVPNERFIGIAAGENFSLALNADGTLAAWGDNSFGQCDIPEDNTDFVAISAGAYHALALKIDGSIRAWGFDGDGQCQVPDPNEDFVGIAAGLRHSLALKSDGSIVGWGNQVFEQTSQSITPNLDFLKISAGGWHSMSVKITVDLSGNGCINNEDMAIFSSQWLNNCTYPDYCQGADFQPDGIVDLGDLIFIGDYWLSECN